MNTNWRIIYEDDVDADYGLAADEYLSKIVGELKSPPTLRLYTYKSTCALSGRFQNIENEIDIDFCNQHGIALNRRPTGGGAIIMGKDQLGIAFILPGKDGDNYSRAREMMESFSNGIRNALRNLGINSEFKRKNDVEINGKKIAGLGIYRHESGGLLFHSSLLIDLDIRLMLQILKTSFEKFSDKEVKTIQGRITTVNSELKTKVTVDEVRDAIKESYQNIFNVSFKHSKISVEEKIGINELIENKYSKNNWIFQESNVADSEGTAKLKTDAGLIDIKLTIAGKVIKSIVIGGDFFVSENALADLEAHLRWHTTNIDSVSNTIQKVYSNYNGQLSSLPKDKLIEAVGIAINRSQLMQTKKQIDPYGCFVNPSHKYSNINYESSDKNEFELIRENNFGNQITFNAPGFKKYRTSEYSSQNTNEFVSVSVTGNACALNCEHCKKLSLNGMASLPDYKKSLFDLAKELIEQGTKGILISGGSDKTGKVPLKNHINDIIKISNELDLHVSIHPGLATKEDLLTLSKAKLQGVMLDIIGDQKTINEVYHLDRKPEDYEEVLKNIVELGLPAIPHILLGHYFGKMVGEYAALEMVKKFPLKMLVIIISMPLPNTGFTEDAYPSIEEIEKFFKTARRELPNTKITLGCARPMGKIKNDIDRLAIDFGLNGIAFPSDGIVQYSNLKKLNHNFIDSCCGVYN